MENDFSSPVLPPEQKTNTLSIASLVLGVVGLLMSCLAVLTAALGIGVVCGCLGFLLGIAALVTGFMARSQIKTSGEKGAGLALAGMLTGGLQVVLMLCSVVAIAILTLLGPQIGNIFSSINQSLK
jgi:hypothetical protein